MIFDVRSWRSVAEQRGKRGVSNNSNRCQEEGWAKFGQDWAKTRLVDKEKERKDNEKVSGLCGRYRRRRGDGGKKERRRWVWVCAYGREAGSGHGFILDIEISMVNAEISRFEMMMMLICTV